METNTLENNQQDDSVAEKKGNMRKMFPILAVAILALVGTVGTSYLATKQSTLNTRAAAIVTPPVAMPNGKTKIMMSALNGTIVIREIEGKTWVNVNIPTKGEDTVSDKDYPLTIQEGTCANPGAVKYTLTAIDDGGSETFLPVSLADFRAQLPLSLVAHASATNPTSVSCGDISLVY